MRKLIITLLILTFCFLPILETSVPVVEDRQLVESYVAKERVTVPSIGYTTKSTWDDGGWSQVMNSVPFTVDEAYENFRSVKPGRWITTQEPVVSYNTVERDVVRRRAVVKPVTVLKEKRVSLVRLIFG